MWPRCWPLCWRRTRAGWRGRLRSLSQGSSVLRRSLQPSPLPPVPWAQRGASPQPGRRLGFSASRQGRATPARLRWRSGFGVGFSVSPTIVMLFLWIRPSHTLHLPTCWSQYLVSAVTCEVCPDTPRTPALGHPCRSEHAGRAARERESCCDSDARAGSLGGETAAPDAEEAAREPLAARETWAGAGGGLHLKAEY